MGQIRECTVCSRRMYSLAEANFACNTRGGRKPKCRGRMLLVSTIQDRPRYRYRMDGTKLGEFW